jgi:glycosyltransferase involved in cell wall biosynthesis
MSRKRIKSCLVVSYGPVPTPQYQKVEGGGMRAWGLAEGLKSHGIDVTVGVNNSFPQELEEHSGIRLVNWGQDQQFIELLNSYDAVLVSYTMGSDSVFIAEHIDDSVQLILDAYVPIYVEVSARESKDMDTEFSNYMADIVRFNRVLRRGDYFLCANEAQKTFYIGVLSSLGIINPRSYREDRILIAPFGIHDAPATTKRNPYKKLGIKDSDFITLWFGGLYPWFRIQELLDAVLEQSKNTSFKFVVVGGKNPFNPNPDFSKQYETALSFAKEHKLLDRSVFFVDWVDFDDRINWFKNAAVVVSLNQPGQENGFSWRTRVMDFVWGEVPILTNGGDPLSDDLIRAHAAVKLDKLTAKAIVESLEALQKSPSSLRNVREKVVELKPQYYWQNIMQPVSKLIENGGTPFADELAYKKKLGIKNDGLELMESDTPRGKTSKARQAIALPRKIISHARRKGLKRSAKLALNISKTQARKYASVNRKRRFVFISHPIDNTGAPLVLLQIVQEYARKYGGKQILLVTPDIGQAELRRLRQLDVKVDKAALGLSFRLIRLQLGLRKNDFVLMNTVAIYDNYRDFILLWLKTGRLKHAFWFIHEDIAQLPVIHKEFLDERNLQHMHKLAEQGKLSILTPSQRTKEEYVDLLKAGNIQSINLRVEVDSKYITQRKENEYGTINFLLSGTPSDGRKGQMLALSAFYSFIKNHYEKNPKDYRNFKLHLVAIGEDYLSQQIKWIGDSLLSKHTAIYPSLPKSEALNVTSKCNAVICCSLNETFGLYVAEGMLMGHVVLRNNSAGIDEQLKEGINGYFIDHTDIDKFAGVLERVLNKKTTSNLKLKEMGMASQEMIRNYSNHDYLGQLERRP